MINYEASLLPLPTTYRNQTEKFMRNLRIFPIVFALVVFAVPAIAQIALNIPPKSPKSSATSEQITAEEIVARYLEARGGLDKILAIRTLIYRNEYFAMTRMRPYFFLVGDPDKMATAEYAEGNDGSHWEFFRDQGLVLRTTGAPANAIRHTAYFDDALVMSAREPGWTVDLIGKKMIGDKQTYDLKVVYPDGFVTHQFVDTKTFLLAANRITAPVHAFGNAVESETRFSNWKSVNGVLYWTDLTEIEIATGKVLDTGGWKTIEANVEISPDVFSPPDYEKTPLNRMLNAVYAARNIPVNSLGWYEDFKNNPVNKGVDTSLGMSSIGYQVLKTGAVETAILLLEANVRDYPKVAHAHFGLGRAYITAGRKQDGIAAFRKALEVDPAYKRAADALEQAVGTGRI